MVKSRFEWDQIKLKHWWLCSLPGAVVSWPLMTALIFLFYNPHDQQEIYWTQSITLNFRLMYPQVTATDDWQQQHKYFFWDQAVALTSCRWHLALAKSMASEILTLFWTLKVGQVPNLLRTSIFVDRLLQELWVDVLYLTLKQSFANH